MPTFEGKAAVVTGGSRGIGRAIAARLAREGADIFLIASDEARVEAAARAIAAESGRRVVGFSADLREAEACRRAHAGATAAFQSIDILANCAGATKGGIFPEQPEEEMVDGFALKFFAAYRLCRLFWPQLRVAHGSVINIVGGFARTPDHRFMVGGAVNAALANFSKALAGQGLEDDVNVNWLHPGVTVTERLEEIFERRAVQEGVSRDEVQRETIAAQRLRRLGTPEDVAELVAFLCRPEARHIHGTGISVDGGGGKGYY